MRLTQTQFLDVGKWRSQISDSIQLTHRLYERVKKDYPHLFAGGFVVNIAPTKEQWKKWSLPARATYVSAIVGFVSLLLGLFAFAVTLFTAKPPERQTTPASKLDNSATELIGLLNVRADKILRRMDEEEGERLTFYHAHQKASCPKVASEADLRNRMAATRQLFQKLHEKNIQAIKDGQLVVAHDVTRDIHLLLYLRRRDLFCDTATKPPPGVAYKRPNPYPGPTACDFEQTELDRNRVLGDWIENVRGGFADPRSCSGSLPLSSERDTEGQARIEALLSGGTVHQNGR
jgi:hypothetical protein